MGKFSDLDLIFQEASLLDEDWSERLPTNEAIPQSNLEEILLQHSAVVSDLKEAEQEIRQALDHWKYYEEKTDLEFLERILTLIVAARRTLA